MEQVLRMQMSLLLSRLKCKMCNGVNGGFNRFGFEAEKIGAEIRSVGREEEEGRGGEGGGAPDGFYSNSQQEERRKRIGGREVK